MWFLYFCSVFQYVIIFKIAIKITHYFFYGPILFNLEFFCCLCKIWLKFFLYQHHASNCIYVTNLTKNRYVYPILYCISSLYFLLIFSFTLLVAINISNRGNPLSSQNDILSVFLSTNEYQLSKAHLLL